MQDVRIIEEQHEGNEYAVATVTYKMVKGEEGDEFVEVDKVDVFARFPTLTEAHDLCKMIYEASLKPLIYKIDGDYLN